MLLFLLICFIAYVAYKYTTNNKGAHPDAPRGSQFFTKRSDLRGALGERTVQADLRTILNSICGEDFYLSPGPLLLNHAPGTEFPTAEVDHLAITPFGVFLVETKHWSGRISAGSTTSKLYRLSPDGTSEERRSPLAQNRSKVAFIKTLLPADWIVRGVGVFSAPDVHIDSTLPLDLICRDEAYHWFRCQQAAHRNSGKPRIQINTAKGAILNETDASHTAIRNHIERTSKA